jgi:hypothetical protein
MTSLSRKSIRLVGLFGLFLAMSGAFWWSGAGWAQTSPHPTPGMQCMTPNPDCIAKAAPYCAQKVGASNSGHLEKFSLRPIKQFGRIEKNRRGVGDESIWRGCAVARIDLAR